eukprot:4738-Heterococcus_DN1.PRE.4
MDPPLRLRPLFLCCKLNLRVTVIAKALVLQGVGSMCWSQGTSAVVVAFEITCLFIIAFKCKGPRFSALPLQLSVLSMELIEFFLWPHVTDDVTNADQGSKTPSCTHWNKILTTVVFFNLTLQPLLLNYGAYLLHRTRSKQGLVLSAA